MYKINDFSKETNISIQTLRYYDKINLFKPSYVDFFTGYRYYQEDQIYKVKLIMELKDIGLSLEKIKLYLETYNNNILLDYKEEMKNKMNKIDDLLNKKDKYTIKQYDYKKYVEINGLRQADCCQALEVRDNNATYYIIEKNSKFFDDFVIYTDEKWITINKRYFNDEILIKTIFDYVKKEVGYDYVIIYVPKEESVNIPKEYKIETSVINQKQWFYDKIKIYL